MHVEQKHVRHACVRACTTTRELYLPLLHTKWFNTIIPVCAPQKECVVLPVEGPRRRHWAGTHGHHPRNLALKAERSTG